MTIMARSFLKRISFGFLAATMLVGMFGCAQTTTDPIDPIDPIPEGAKAAVFHKISDYSAFSAPAVESLTRGHFCVAEKGLAMATIVVAENASDKVHAAARDLSDNLKLLTGAEFMIKTDAEVVDGAVILVGESKRTEDLGISFPNTYPGEEMFRVIAGKDTLVLGGNDAGSYNGTKFAVTYLLEALGFGWFGDTDLWKVTPEPAETVYVPSCDIASKASFTSRYTRLCNYDKALTERWFVGGVENITEHMLYYYLPRSLYAEHPEYFALSQGTRDPAGKRFFQPCLSNPELQDLVAQQVIEEFKKNPNLVIASVGQQDGCGDPNNPDYANWCECDNCKAFAFDFTEALMEFANIIGRKIKDECPGKAIMFYGYYETFTAPRYIDFQAEDNVILMLCKEGGLTRLIENGNLFNEELGQPQFDRNYQNWKKLGYRIAIYEWNCPGAASDQWKDCFWIQGDVFLGNLRWFKDNGVEYLYVDQTSLPYYEREEAFMDIRWPLYYLSARSMWDCGLSFKEIMMPACEKLYGPAAESMYTFYDALNQANLHCEAPTYRWAMAEPYQVYTDSYIADADAALQNALTQAKTVGGAVQERVENQITNWENSKTYFANQ